MKKITITTENKYKTYLKVISSIFNITNKEIELLSLFYTYSHFPIKNAEIKKTVAKDLGISIKTLHIMLKNLISKGILFKTSRGIYNVSDYIMFSGDSVLIKIKEDGNNN